MHTVSIAGMDDNQIWVTKAGQRSTLGAEPAYRPDTLAQWTGLKLVRFRMPATRSDYAVRADHPILSLMCSGRSSARLRIGLAETHTEYRAEDLMCYGGGREIASCHWLARDATMISVELDPGRLLLAEGGDPRFEAPTLQGTPRFADPAAATLILALWREVASGCPQGQLHADSLCLGLAAYAHRRFGTLKPDAREAVAKLAPAQLRRVEDFIEAHLAEAIGLADLAREAGLSRYHFSRLFRNTVGRSPHQHVMHLRLVRAHGLLTTSRMTLAQIALQVGFSSQSHFASAFRRVLGEAPGAVRARRAA